MIKPEQVPDNVLNVAVETYYRELADADSEGLAYSFRAAIAAALNAWPKSELVETSSGLTSRSRTWLANELPIIILPLGDDK